MHNYFLPELSANDLGPVVLGYEHNSDGPSFPQELLSGSSASDYSAIAWHCYDNDSGPTVMAQLHDQYPSIDQYELGRAQGGVLTGTDAPMLVTARGRAARGRSRRSGAPSVGRDERTRAPA